MKLSLRHEDGIAILDISGAVSEHELSVLKAGLTKLLQAGKNRIVLHFVDADQLVGEVLREIAILDLFARELSGRIIIAAENDVLKQSIKSFAKPPSIPVLASAAKAIEYFKLNDPTQEESEESLESLKEQLKEKDKAIKALEEQLRLVDKSQITTLRAENAEMKKRVSLLEKQVDDMVKERRDPMDVDGLLEKNLVLEETVKRLSAQAGAAKGK